MPRKRKLSDEDRWEQEIEDAVEGVKCGKYSGAREAARLTGLSRTTIGERLKGRPTRRKAHEVHQKLAHVEEKELARAVRLATIAGKPLLPEAIREMGEGLMKRRVKGVNENGVVLVEYEPLGKRWPGRFIKRQKELHTERTKKIEAVRQEVKIEDLKTWFEELERVVQEYDILPKNIYNMDETGFNIGDYEARNVVVDTSVQSHYQAQSGRQEWVTTVECICVDGSWVPPLVIFTGETFVKQWVPKDFDPSWKFSNTIKGWTSNEHGLKWLKLCFEPATREKADGRYRLLILDGHGSHCTSDFLAHAMEHKILVFLLVAHSSHISQPLDATIFGPLKRILSRTTAPLFQLGIFKMPKDEWIEAYYTAHQQAFSVKNIKAGFSSTGIYPFNPVKVLNRIHTTGKSDSIVTPTLQVPTASVPTTPTSSIMESTPFSTQVLTSSPPDFVIFQAANSALNHMVETAQPLPTPARKFVRCVTSAAEKLFARSSILQERTEAQEALLAKRKQRESIKRSFIKGKGLISTPEIHSAKVESERNLKTKQRKCTTYLFLC